MGNKILVVLDAEGDGYDHAVYVCENFGHYELNSSGNIFEEAMLYGANGETVWETVKSLDPSDHDKN